MEIKILRERIDEIEFEIKGEDHTFCNPLRNVLNQNNKVEFATYRIEHPLLSNPIFYVKIKTKKKEPKLSSIVKKKEDLEKLKEYGIESVYELANANIDELSDIENISEYVKKAKKYESEVRKVIKEALKDFQKIFEEIKNEFKKQAKC